MEEAKQIVRDIKEGKISPLYFLMGEEPFYIDYISDYIENNLIAVQDRDFNMFITYGKDTNINDIVQYAREFPMMAQRRVIIVKEAQNLQDIDKLQSYIEKPSKTTTLVFCYKYGKLDARKKIYKELSKYVVFESDKLRDYQVVGWIPKIAKEFGFKISPISAQLIVDYMGNDLNAIYNQINKISITLGKGEEITPEVIEKNIGISKEFNTFELIKAIGEKNHKKCFTIAKYMLLNQKNKESLLPQVITPVYNFFERLFIVHSNEFSSDAELSKMMGVNVFFVKDYRLACKNYTMKQVSKKIETIREIDLKGKGVGVGKVSGQELIKELLIRILN